jgi:hypothetical protein
VIITSISVSGNHGGLNWPQDFLRIGVVEFRAMLRSPVCNGLSSVVRDKVGVRVWRRGDAFRVSCPRRVLATSSAAIDVVCTEAVGSRASS